MEPQRADEIIEIIRSCPVGKIYEEVPGYPGVLENSIAPPVSSSSIDEHWEGKDLPAELSELWGKVGAFRVLYLRGVYGISVYGPKESREATEILSTANWIDDDMFHDSDVLMGDFQGRAGTLIFSADDGWLVASNIDERDDWIYLGRDLCAFLTEFRDVGGPDGDWHRKFHTKAS